MGYPHDLRCPTDMEAPRATGICDRCGAKYWLDELPWQWDVRGNTLQNLRLRVCERCYDDPAWILKPVIIVGPEGVVKDPRPYLYPQESSQGTSTVYDFAPNWPSPSDPYNIPAASTAQGSEIVAPGQIGSPQPGKPTYQKGQMGI